MKLSKRELTLIVVLIVVAVSLAYYKFVFEPFVAQNNAITAEIEDLKKSIGFSKAQQQALGDMEQKLDDLNRQADELFAEVPDLLDEPELLEAVSGTLEGLAYNISLVLVPDEIVFDGGSVSTVGVSADCNYEDIRVILSNIESLGYLANVTNLQISSVEVIYNPPEGGEIKLNSSVSFTIEFLSFGGVADYSKPEPLIDPNIQGNAVLIGSRTSPE